MKWSVGLVFATGCSLIGAAGREPHEPCSRSLAAPVVDTAVAVTATALAGFAYAHHFTYPDKSFGRIELGIGVASTVVALPYAISAIVGYRSVGRCRRR